MHIAQNGYAFRGRMRVEHTHPINQLTMGLTKVLRDHADFISCNHKGTGQHALPKLRAADNRNITRARQYRINIGGDKTDAQGAARCCCCCRRHWDFPVYCSYTANNASAARSIVAWARTHSNCF